MPGRNNTCITCLHAIAHHHRPTHIHTHTWRPPSIRSRMVGMALHSAQIELQCSVCQWALDERAWSPTRFYLIVNNIVRICKNCSTIFRLHIWMWDVLRILTRRGRLWYVEVPTNNNYDAMMFLFRLLWSMMMMCDRFRMSAQKQINVHILTDWGNYLGCTTTCLSIDIAAAAMYKFYALT